MRSKIAKSLRVEFEKLLKSKLPQFKPVKAREIEAPWGEHCKEIPLGDRLYLWKYNQIYGFIWSLLYIRRLILSQ